MTTLKIIMPTIVHKLSFEIDTKLCLCSDLSLHNILHKMSSTNISLV